MQNIVVGKLGRLVAKLSLSLILLACLKLCEDMNCQNTNLVSWLPVESCNSTVLNTNTPIFQIIQDSAMVCIQKTYT